MWLSMIKAKEMSPKNTLARPLNYNNRKRKRANGVIMRDLNEQVHLIAQTWFLKKRFS